MAMLNNHRFKSIFRIHPIVGVLIFDPYPIGLGWSWYTPKHFLAIYVGRGTQKKHPNEVPEDLRGRYRVISWGFTVILQYKKDN